MPSKTVLKLQAATLQSGRGAAALRVLDAISLQIDAGERVALIGANGSGKSSLLRVLAGVQPLSGGRRTAVQGPYGMVFQQPYLLRMPVLWNVALAPWLSGVPWRHARQRARATLQRFGLADLASYSAHTLSGGQAQRVAIARAWAAAPGILFLDEPSASLDPHAKRDAEDFLQSVTADDPGLTLVFASHNLGQVKRLATRVLYLDAGRVCVDLPVAEFFSATRVADVFPEAHHFVRADGASRRG